MEIKKKIYFENLNGLRFLCFLAIFFYHSFYSESAHITQNPLYRFVERDVFGNGNLGVNFFFVLSGFLITFLLIEEKKLNGQVNIGKFWLRRILRIWPLYYFCIFFGFVIFPYLKELFGQVPDETASPAMYLLFLSNLEIIEKGLPDSSVLGILWSIAIEEQFYFVWPLILFVFPISKLWVPFAVIIIGSISFRAYYDDGFMNEFHTFSCIGDMTIGAVGAWLINVSSGFKKTIENLSRIKIAVIYLIFAIIFFSRYKLLVNIEMRVVERSIIACVIVLIILEQTFSKRSFFKMANFKIISELGKISYGLYCFHFIGILVTLTLTQKFGLNKEMWQLFLIDVPASLAITIVISKLSYRYFETPFLKLKDRFSFITKS